jgi:hypothetical protein
MSRLRWSFVWCLALSVVLGALLWSGTASAQLRFHMKDVETQVDANEVEIGDAIHVTMRVMSESTLPERPDLGSHPGFSVRSPSVSQSQMVQSINGKTSVRRGITVTWTLTAQSAGSFTIGPPSAFIGTSRVTSDAVRVRVMKKGALTRGSDPLDPFGAPSTLDPWKSFFGTQDSRDPRAAPATDPALTLDHDDSTPLFMHATLDKTSAVVGEQVTYTALLYVDPDVSDQDFIMEHEAPAASFLKRPLVADDANSKLLGYAKVRSRVYRVKQVRKIAFFPVATGNQEIGEQEIRYPLGNRYVSSKTPKLTVKVTEPPTQGRPLGYTLGDTGHFELSAEVKPRDIDQGDVTSIIVTLSGTGNVPRAALPVPLQKDVAFLQPEISEKLGSADHDRFAASDTFRYVVRIDRAGDVDLGTIELPYYDPDKKAYATTRAVLGVIHVKKGDVKQAAPADPNPVVLPEAPPPIGALDGTRPAAEKHFADTGLFWLLLCASPLSYALIRVSSAGLRRFRKQRAERAQSPDADLARRHADAKARAKEASGKALVAAVKRYVEEIATARAGVNVKGAPAERAAELLTSGGVAEAHASEAGALLTECASLAFTPDEVPMSDAAALLARAEKLDRALASEESA